VIVPLLAGCAKPPARLITMPSDWLQWNRFVAMWGSH